VSDPEPGGIPTRDVAFYYPHPIWRDPDWAKSLLVFFDAVALLVPNYMRDRPLQIDPVVAGALDHAGLLERLEAETTIDAGTARRLEDVVMEFLDAGYLDSLARDTTAFAELSWSRLGGTVAPELAERIFQALAARGLAQPSRDGVSVPLHPLVRSLILTLLAQMLPTAVRGQGLTLIPATDRPDIQLALSELLGLDGLPTAGNVVSLDLESVGIDLAAVPIDEVLAFRQEHGPQFRAYRRDVDRFAREISSAPSSDRERAYKERRELLADAGAVLRQAWPAEWRQYAMLAITATGAWFTLDTGDPRGAAVALASALLGFAYGPQLTGEAQALSYLFEARRRYGRPASD
jgi:hypothetical protein